jgi:hypothetical protein
MTRRVLLIRTCAAGFALAHLLLATLGPLADARLEAAERDAVAHVEEQRSEPCTPGHDHLFCQVCRSITLPAGPAPAVWCAPGDPPVTTAATRQTPGITPLHSLTRAHGPRAPPLS